MSNPIIDIDHIKLEPCDRIDKIEPENEAELMRSLPRGSISSTYGISCNGVVWFG